MGRSIREFAELHDVTDRTVRRWIQAGKIEAVEIAGGRGYTIPDDVTPPAIDGRTAAAMARAAEREQLAAVARAHGVSQVNVPTGMGATAVGSYEAPPTMARRFWFTVDDLVVLWDPLVSRHAIVKMLRSGELIGYQRGSNGSWVIPASEVRRIAG
jgi:excisionase family DNA binding protein